MNNKSALIICLVLIAVTVVFVNSIASNFAPEKQALANQTTLLAEAQSARDALALKNETIRSQIITEAVAQSDKQIMLDNAKAKGIGELNQLNAQYQARLAEIQKDIEANQALALAAKILIAGLSVALVLVAFAGGVYTFNRANVVRVGETSLVFRGNKMYQPEGLIPYMATDEVPRWARAILWLRTVLVVKIKPTESPWEVVEQARHATQPRLDLRSSEDPQMVLALKQAQGQVKIAGLLAKRMNSREAKETAARVSAPVVVTEFTAPEIGYLPASAHQYQLLEESAEAK